MKNNNNFAANNFLSIIENNINNVRLLGLDVTMIKLNSKDAMVFKNQLSDISGIEIDKIKTYKGISVRKSIGVSMIVGISNNKDNARYFDINTGIEL